MSFSKLHFRLTMLCQPFFSPCSFRPIDLQLHRAQICWKSESAFQIFSLKGLNFQKKWAWKLIFCLFPAFLRAKPTVQGYIHFMVNFVQMKSIGWERRQRCDTIGGFAKAFSSWLAVRAFFPSDSPLARQLRANSSVSTETQHLSFQGGSYMKREISGGSVDLNSSVIFHDVKKTLSAWFNNSDIGRKDDM